MFIQLMKKRGFFLAVPLFVFALSAPFAFGVDAPNGTWRDNQGITVDSGSRNADAIRRSQTREQRNINQLHEAVNVGDRR